jgi:hypothetical protein
MSSAAQAYLNALRGLSANSNPIIVQARSNLFKNIGDEDLREILKICLDQNASRTALEGAISALLDPAVNENENETIKLESSPPAPTIPAGERTSIKRKRSETDSTRRESVLSFRSKTRTPAMQRNIDNSVLDLSSEGLESDDDTNDEPRQQVPAAPAAPARKTKSSPPKTDRPLPEIKKALCIPDTSGKSTFKSFTSLKNPFVAALQTRFESTYLDTPGHATEYRRMLANPSRHVASGCCVNNLVFCKSGKEMSWEKADGNRNRACDHCVARKRVCAKLVKGGMDGEVEMVVFALPAAMREGRKWDEMGFWVQE